MAEKKRKLPTVEPKPQYKSAAAGIAYAVDVANEWFKEGYVVAWCFPTMVPIEDGTQIPGIYMLAEKVDAL
jgi:hypothetical protein